MATLVPTGKVRYGARKTPPVNCGDEQYQTSGACPAPHCRWYSSDNSCRPSPYSLVAPHQEYEESVKAIQKFIADQMRAGKTFDEALDLATKAFERRETGARTTYKSGASKGIAYTKYKKAAPLSPRMKEKQRGLFVPAAGLAAGGASSSSAGLGAGAGAGAGAGEEKRAGFSAAALAPGATLTARYDGNPWAYDEYDHRWAYDEPMEYDHHWRYDGEEDEPMQYDHRWGYDEPEYDNIRRYYH